jgi:hypothetical protein
LTSSPEPVARSDLTWISARSLGTTPPGSASSSAAREPSLSQKIAPGLQQRLARAVEAVTLLHRDAADRLSAGVLDDADAQRLQLAVELTGDQPLPQQLRRRGRIMGEDFGEDWLRRPLCHRRRRRDCSKEQ